MKPKFRKFPRFIDSRGRLVFVRVTAEGLIQFRSQSNRKGQINLAGVWEALQAPDTFREAVEDLRRSSLRFLEARSCTFPALETNPVCTRLQIRLQPASSVQEGAA